MGATKTHDRRELPFVTVVTDLGGAHPTWFNHEADKVFIASDAVMRVAFRQGLSSAQVGLSFLVWAWVWVWVRFGHGFGYGFGYTFGFGF